VETDLALELAMVVRQVALERDMQVTVAVHDAAGHPVVVIRGKQKWHGPYMAMGKARLASAFQKPTAELVERWADRPLFANSLIEVLPGDITVNPGGYPIFVDDECIGAVGVGGGNPEEDHEVARIAVERFVAGLADDTTH
jgi:uncharacterized protein GlcG (DUF336 family)